jgi:hypothetical protein
LLGGLSINEIVKEEIIERFKARQFLFNSMHIDELYLAFRPLNTLDVVIKMADKHNLEEERTPLSIFFAATLGLQLELTFYILDIHTYNVQNKLVKIG